ncbi:hypothetical protein FNF27_01852 [Cafeteria roenbergensis]|uniref:Uncharacterized protein n=1 Tax=Cafeteria roenbergensis TaxID=33653 RepID=A0A5A8ELE1_CAFRO|nr:hypothetical protein FNF27_01852 [Cafeteria roenbergensis]
MSIAESAAELEQYYDRNAVPKVDPATLANKVLRPATFRAFMADYQISLMQVAQATQLSESLLEAWLTGSLRKNPEARRLIVPKLLALKHEEREFRKLASAAKRDAMATGGGATHARKEPPAWHGTGVGAATSADAAGAPAAPHVSHPTLRGRSASIRAGNGSPGVSRPSSMSPVGPNPQGGHVASSRGQHGGHLPSGQASAGDDRVTRGSSSAGAGFGSIPTSSSYGAQSGGRSFQSVAASPQSFAAAAGPLCRMAWTVASGRDDETAAGQRGSPAGCPLHLAPVVLRGPPPPALRSQECPPPREDAPFTSAWRSAEASDSPVSSGLMLRVPPSLPEAVFRSCAPQPAAGEQPAAGAAEGASAGAAAHPEPHGSAAGCWREARRVSDADGELSADDYTSEALPRHGTFSHGEGEIGPLDCTAVLSVMLTGAVASAAFDAVLELEDALAEARGIAEGRRSSTRRPKVLGSASEGMLSDIDDGAGSALEGGRWPREDEVEDGYFDDGLSDGESDDSDEESARDGDPEAEALAAKGEPGHRRPGKYVPTALRMSASRSSRGRSRPEPGLEQVVVRVGGGTVTRFGWAQLVSDAAAASLLRLAGLTAAAVSAARQARPDDDQPLPHAGAAGGPRDGSGYPSHALGADSVWHSASEATTRSDPWAAEIAASEAAALPLLAAAERIASAGPIGAGTRHSRWTCVVREAALAASTACAALGLERAARYGARGSTTAPSTAASERDVAAVLSALTPQTHCCQGCPPVGCAPATGLAPTAPGSVITPSVLASVAAGLRPPPPGAHCPLTAGRRLQLQEQDARTRRLATGTGSVGTGTGTGTGGGAGAGAGAVDPQAPPLAGPPSVRSRPFDYQQQPASWSGVPYSSPGEGADRGPKRHRVDAEEFLGPAATVPTPSAKPVSRSTPMRSTEADLGAADILLTVAGGSAISGDDKRSDRMRAPPGPASIVSSLQDGGSGGEPDGFAQQNPLMPPRLEGGPDARHGYRAGLPSDRGAGSPDLGVYTRQGFGTHAPPATSQGLPRVNSGLAVSMLSLSSAQQSTSQQRQVPSSASAMMVGPGGVMPSGSSGRYGDAMGLPNASSLSVLSGVYTSSQHPGLYIPGLFAGRGAASDLQDAAAQPTMAMGAATVLSGMSKGASQGHGGPRAGRGPSAASPMLSRPGSVGSSDRGNPLPSRGPAYPRPQGLARQLDEGDGGITIAEAFAGHMTDAERRAAYFEATTGAAHSEQQPGARDSQGSRRLPATRRVPPGRPGSSHYSMFGV